MVISVKETDKQTHRMRERERENGAKERATRVGREGGERETCRQTGQTDKEREKDRQKEIVQNCKCTSTQKGNNDDI